MTIIGVVVAVVVVVTILQVKIQGKDRLSRTTVREMLALKERGMTKMIMIQNGQNLLSLHGN